MSTRVIRSIHDFLRHRMGVEILCKCGHKAVLDARVVSETFTRNRWTTGLEGAMWLKSAHAYFRCSKCGARGAERIGPKPR